MIDSPGNVQRLEESSTTFHLPGSSKSVVRELLDGLDVDVVGGQNGRFKVTGQREDMVLAGQILAHYQQ